MQKGKDYYTKMNFIKETQVLEDTFNEMAKIDAYLGDIYSNELYLIQQGINNLKERFAKGEVIN